MRLIILHLLLFVSVFCYAQKVQSKFFGYGLGSKMYHMQQAMEAEGYVNFKDNENLLSAYDVSFGGLTWPIVEFEYYKDQFYHVYFSKNYKSKSDALFMFNSLKQRLKEKYKGICWEKKNDLGVSELMANDDVRSMFLNLSYSMSKGGEMYYYLTLSYYENYIWDKSSENDDNEL